MAAERAAVVADALLRTLTAPFTGGSSARLGESCQALPLPIAYGFQSSVRRAVREVHGDEALPEASRFASSHVAARGDSRKGSASATPAPRRTVRRLRDDLVSFFVFIIKGPLLGEGGILSLTTIAHGDLGR